MNEKVSKTEEKEQVSLQNRLDGLKYVISEYHLMDSFGGAPKITYVHTIYSYIQSVIKSLENHLQTIEQNTCNETLTLDFKQATQKNYWLQDDCIREDMLALADKPISDYELKIVVYGKEFKDSLELYKAIDEGLEKIITLLKKVEEAQ